MRLRLLLALGMTLVLAVSAVAPVVARDRPFGTSTIHFDKFLTPTSLVEAPFAGQSGGQFSKQQLTKLTCESSGNPAGTVDMSCAEAPDLFGDFAPDNEIAIAVDPLNPSHLLAGSNDYFYRFNNSTGARQAFVPTGFFTSFDGGATWLDGQIPVRTGNGAGDPAPAFNAAFPDGDGNSLAIMAQLENAGGQGGPYVSQGDVSVSRSTDGGVTWSPPITVMKGNGTGIGPANQAVFWDKEWIAVDNNPDSPYFGRTYVTATRFLNGIQGAYTESPIWLSYSDDGGLTWSKPAEISGSHPSCTYQETGPENECDENQFSNPVVAPDGTVYVYFYNDQNEAEWEWDFDFDDQIMVVKSTDGGVTFGAPVQVAQVEDGGHDMPYSVIGRQTIWGHQIRWASFGNLAIDPTDPQHMVAIWSDRGTPNPNATNGCYYLLPRNPDNDYDPCGAGPGAVVSIYMAESTDGGASWGPRTLVSNPDGVHQWFGWAGFKSDGTLVVAFDQDTAAAPADTFEHVLWTEGGGQEVLGVEEHIDVSATHWAGQYTTAWPDICGPNGSPDAGKTCNAFHGDYTGLAVGPDDAVHVVWTGLNQFVTTPQIDFYTGEYYAGYRQDAMYAQR